MSSKFFTWTKGDRRNAAEALRSGGVVPIPAECLTIKGMDYTRSSKGKHRKPLSLALDQPSYTTPPHASRSSDSIAFHDAAVQSATSLMAVMNDMLRSPQLSAHMSTQRPPDLLPPYSRPRSHTAPSTPVLEAACREPAELPGSFPADLLRTKPSLPSKNASDTGLEQVHSCTGAGTSIVRPHSSPQETSFHTRLPGIVSPPSLLGKVDKPRLDQSATLQPQATYPVDSNDVQGEVTRSAFTADKCDLNLASKRPKLSCVQPAREASPSLTSSTISSQRGSSTVVPTAGETAGLNISEDVESVLLQEIARLRASQDAHLRSLKEAHEKELASHKSYISILERRRVPAALITPAQQQRLTLDTSQSGARAELHSEPSVTTMKSFESSLDDTNRTFKDATTETEALRRKLSLCAKTQVDAVEIQRERDELKNAADRSGRRILQLKESVRKAKENEKALRNQALDLECRLVDANNERLDVLEGFHDACSQARAANEREQRLAQELDTLQVRERDAKHGRTAKHQRTLSEASALPTMPQSMDPTMRQLIETRKMLAAKDERIKQLESAISQDSDRGTSYKTMETQVVDLQRRLKQQNEILSSVQSDAERYNSLLHNELRRQARTAARHKEGSEPRIEAEAFMVATEKMVRLRSRTETTGIHDASSAPLPAEASAAAIAATMEKELDHCIKEIILYKLDIKGYRKDLKKANAEIEHLRALGVNRPPTPDRDSLSSERSQQSRHSTGLAPTAEKASQASSGPCDPGLGISLPQPPKTPTKRSSVAAATAAALSSPLASPPLRTKTPLNTHKKLPKPPTSRTPSPLPPAFRTKWPEQDVTRTQTLRSLSESIISSYGKRGQMEPEMAAGPRARDMREGPVSPPTPLSRCGAESKNDWENRP